MKMYLVLEVQNTGGVPPDKDALSKIIAQRIIDHVPGDQVCSGGQVSNNEIVRANILEVEA